MKYLNRQIIRSSFLLFLLLQLIACNDNMRQNIGLLSGETIKVKVTIDKNFISATSKKDLIYRHLYDILNDRIEAFGATVDKTSVERDSGFIYYTISGVKDSSRLVKLLGQNGKLEFYNTYEAAEIVPTICAVDLQLSKMYKEGNLTPDDAKIQRQISGGSVLAPGNVLFSVLYPNIVNKNGHQVIGEGAMVGQAVANDTGLINRYLAYPQIKAMLPDDLKLFWGPRVSKKSTVLLLYAIRQPFQLPEAPLTGSSVENIFAYSRDNEAEVDMGINMKGSTVWEEMTKNATAGNGTKKCIAVVVDGTVFSAPRYIKTITDGRCVVDGLTNMAQAYDLAILIKNGELGVPVTVKIL